MGVLDGFIEGAPLEPKYQIGDENKEPDFVEEFSGLYMGDYACSGIFRAWYSASPKADVPCMKIALTVTTSFPRVVISDGEGGEIIYPARTTTETVFPYGCAGYNFMWQFRYKYFQIAETLGGNPL